MIFGTVGRLGKGKTASGVIQAYDDLCQGRVEKVYSNIWLRFPHVPIKKPTDFVGMNKGFCLGDELWSLADNRKSMTALSDVMTLILILSRKKDYHVFYTQQYLQIDVRIRFITDIWIKPKCFDINNVEVTTENKLTPAYIMQQVYDGDFNRLQPRVVLCDNLLSLYDCNRSPYTLKAALTDDAMKAAFDKALASNPGLDEEYEDVGEDAKHSTRVRKGEDYLI